MSDFSTAGGGINAGTLTVRIVSDATGLSRDVTREVDQAAGAAGAGLGKAQRDIGARARDIGAKATVGLTLPLVMAGKYALDAASDVVEGTNKVNVVFGDQAKQVLDWSEGTAKAFGISKRDALASAGAFGSLFTTMGLSKEASRGMSIDLTELGADMASFSNATPTEALEALRAGLNGESEPLRRFGVFMSEARVQAMALSEGIAKPVKNMALIREAQAKLEVAQRSYNAAVKEHGKDSTEAAIAMGAVERANQGVEKAMAGSNVELTEAQKAQARHAIIMQDTVQAQGDVARSAKTSAAVQSSMAKAARDDAAAALGEALLPMSIATSKAIAGMANAFGDLSPGMQKATTYTLMAVAALGPMLSVYGNLARVGKGVVGVLGKLAAAKGAEAAATTGSTTATVANTTATKVNTVTSKAAAVASRVLAVAQRALGVAVRFAMGPWGIAIAVIGLVVAAIIHLWKNSETFRNFVRGALRVIGDAFRTTFDAVKRVLEAVGRFLTGAFLGYFRTMFAVYSAIFRAIRDTVQAVWGWVVDKLQAGGRAIAAVANGIRNAFSAAFNFVRNVVTGVIDTIRRVINGVIGLLHRLAIPAFNIGVGPIRYSFPGFAPFAGIPFLAAGGIVPATPGGVLARISEAGQDEVVLPLDAKTLERYGIGGAREVHLHTTVHNPAPEPASESVNKRLRRLATLGVVDAAAGAAAGAVG